eukprot:Seg435.11 transcript_id=Seg435.11/GoldUCD/mRNA.D3Y31 product="Transducin beta-like protein 3" protein_id=Seg435.11/GoldUCD/D3Y31
MGPTLKTNFSVKNKLEAFYTGGKVQFSADGEYCFCACGNKVQVLNTNSGCIIKSLSEDDDEITSFTLSPNDEVLITASRSLLLRQWDWKNGKVTRKFKALHNSPIICMVFDPTSTLLATGSTDSTIKIWDIVKQYCTHNFRGSQGVVHFVQFHPDPEKLMLFSSSIDCKIRIWDLNTSKCVSSLEGHFSPVTSLTFLEENQNMISSGRDKVVIFWDLTTRALIKTVPVYESLESVVALPEAEYQWLKNEEDKKGKIFITAGEKGTIRAWSFPAGKFLCSRQASQSTAGIESNENTEDFVASSIVQCMLHEVLGCVVTVTYDHNIILHDLKTLNVSKQFVGHYDEILDVKFVGDNDSLLSIATNSSQVKVIERETMDCRILNGHTETVMSLDASFDGKYIASCSKDNSVRVWRMQDDKTFKCVATGVGHTRAVGAVSWMKNSTNYLVTGSQDLTMKCWKIPQIFEDKNLARLSASWTSKAHDKDINSVAFSPNDKLVASGSQDKTAKLWLASDGSLYGTLRGHKRGIWCVVFSPVDKCLATASADSTIKIWAIQDLTCVKTLEGHTNSVLKLQFMTRGMQIVSSGSDGLIKVWNVKSNECIKTLDEHTDKVWSLALNNAEDTLVTGGSDSVLNLWKDVTEEEKLMEEAKNDELILKDQELSNLLGEKKYIKAIGLAITLDRPFRVLSIIKELLEKANGEHEIEKVIEGLREDQIDSLLKLMRNWNTNAKHCRATQTVLSIVLKTKSPDDLANLSNMKESVEALLPYTERHFNRLNRLLQQSTFLDYTWQSMKLTTQEIEMERPDNKDGKNMENENSFEKINETQTDTHPKTDQETETTVSNDSQGASEVITLKDQDLAAFEESTTAVEAEQDQKTTKKNEKHLEENKENKKSTKTPEGEQMLSKQKKRTSNISQNSRSKKKQKVGKSKDK